MKAHAAAGSRHEPVPLVRSAGVDGDARLHDAAAGAAAAGAVARRAVPVRDHPVLRAVPGRPPADARGRRRAKRRRRSSPARSSSRRSPRWCRRCPWLAAQAVSGEAAVYRYLEGGRVLVDRTLLALESQFGFLEADGFPCRDGPEDRRVRRDLRAGAPERGAARRCRVAAVAAARAVSRVLLPARRPAVPEVHRRSGPERVLRAHAVHDRARRRHRPRVLPGAAQAHRHRYRLPRARPDGDRHAGRLRARADGRRARLGAVRRLGDRVRDRRAGRRHRFPGRSLGRLRGDRPVPGRAPARRFRVHAADRRPQPAACTRCRRCC